jgi:hypothetical protein
VRRYGAPVEVSLGAYRDHRKGTRRRPCWFGARQVGKSGRLMIEPQASGCETQPGTSVLEAPSGLIVGPQTSRLDHSDQQVRSLLRPARRLSPLEIRDGVAAYIPGYRLKTWLLVSAFFHDISRRRISSIVGRHLREGQEHKIRSSISLMRSKKIRSLQRRSRA